MSLRPLIFALAAIPVATLCVASDARADYAFCSATGSSTRCDFQTYEQCQASVSGTGADCIANPAGPPAASIPAPASTRRHRRH